jgi:uncharacterized membrane protein
MDDRSQRAESHPWRRTTPINAREILDESLARGDITIDEYEKRRGAIERSTTGRSE